VTASVNRTPIRLMAGLSLLVVSCLIATGAVAAPPAARGADDSQAKARAQALLSEGTAAYGRGDYATALDKFTAAYRIFPSPKLWFNIGQANRATPRPRPWPRRGARRPS
jgi:hypothetical protein